MMLLGEEETRELRSSGVSGELEKSWSVGIMGIVYGGETEEEGENEGKMCEGGEGSKGRELPVEGTLLPKSMREDCTPIGNTVSLKITFLEIYTRREEGS